MLTPDELEDLGQSATQDIMVATVVMNGDKMLLGEGALERNPFVIPSGHLKSGERPEDCSVRTVEEVSGIVCRNPELIFIHDRYQKDEGKRYVAMGMKSDYQSGKPDERQFRWHWFSPGDALKLNLSKTDKLLIEHFLYTHLNR